MSAGLRSPQAAGKCFYIFAQDSYVDVLMHNRYSVSTGFGSKPAAFRCQQPWNAPQRIEGSIVWTRFQLQTPKADSAHYSTKYRLNRSSSPNMEGRLQS